MGATGQIEYSDFIISRLRQQVDGLDDRLLVLLRQRVKVARQLGQIKRRAGRPLRDATREEQLLERLAGAGGEALSAEAIQRLFRCVIEVSLASEVEDAQ